MNKEELKTRLSELLQNAVSDETGAWLALNIDAIDLLNVMPMLRKELDLDLLFCVTGVDWKTHFSVVYHLTSTNDRNTILVVKAKIADRENPSIPTVSGIWRTAEFHELEVYDFFGIIFTNHPGLRRLFLPEDWKGWPMRKDYSDPVNMITL